jgi:hypothetical protein
MDFTRLIIAVHRNKILIDKGWSKTYEEIVDEVRMRVITDSSGIPQTAYPTWDQP